MKTINILILAMLLIGLTNCKKDADDEINVGITFSQHDLKTNSRSILVGYDEIIGYDSTKYAYVVDELVWGEIKKKIIESNLYVYPFPDFVINISLDNELIHRAGFVPSFSSTLDAGKILFKLQEPNIIVFRTDPPLNWFEGEDLRNDPRLIERLKKDNKLIGIEN